MHYERLNSLILDNNLLFNPLFNDYANLIQTSIKERNKNRDDKYTSSSNRELLRLCESHARDFKVPIKIKDVIMLVHPFYMHLSHKDCIKDDEKGDADNYFHDIINLLRNHNKKKIGIAIMETLHHYAATTSLLLEEGLINEVIITEYSNSKPINNNSLSNFKNKNIFLGGGYNGRCLLSAILLIKNIHPKQLWGIKDLIINSPKDDKPLKINSVDGLSIEKVISLEEALRLIK
ncbi:MAG: hypothetical protein WC307_01255 [Candidatus Nanoarchaeia archaeon]|jgi:hypothetical protein